MEASVAQSSKFDGQSNSKGNTSDDNPEEEIWGDDSDVDSNPGSNHSREWNWRHNRFHTMGYREGITEGKEASAQEGYIVGFRQSVRVGKKWGLVRGITSAVASLPESSVEKLIPNIEIREKLKEIQKAVQAISSDNALRIYHETIKKSDCLTSMDSNDHSEEIFCSKVDSSSNKLESHYKEEHSFGFCDTLERLKKAVTMLDQAAAETERLLRLAKRLGIRDLSESWQEAGKVLRRETTSLLTEREVFGREVEKQKIIDWLKRPTDAHLGSFGIVGVGGQGKTTLVQFAYQEMCGSNHFDKTIWVCVSTNFSVEDITRKILGELGEDSCFGKPLNAIQETLKEKIL